MRVRLLGTAAGGGFPQWNCACHRCTAAGLPPRTQDCLAVSPDTGEGAGGWYLLNASPDIRAQILGSPPLAPPPGTRDTPLRGVLLTDAELDHTLGLLMLREGAGLPVWAPERVLGALREAFPVRRITAGYGDGWRWSAIVPGEPFDVGGLRVTALPVSGKRPRYAAGTDADGPGVWVVAYRVADPVTGGVLVYAPCLAAWPDGLDALVGDADLVLLDGTFYSADELPGSTAMGHLPMAGPDGTLARIRRHRAPGSGSGSGSGRWLYTHLNNTNPAMDPGAAPGAEVRAAGAELPLDGAEFEL